MRTSRFPALALATLAVGVAACGPQGGLRITAPSAPAGPRAVWILGVVLSAADSTPVAQVLLEVYEITGAGAPDIRVGFTRSAAGGNYSLGFAARCDRMYGLKAAFPHAIVRCSRCPVWPLPDACAGGRVDLWVEG